MNADLLLFEWDTSRQEQGEAVEVSGATEEEKNIIKIRLY